MTPCCGNCKFMRARTHPTGRNLNPECHAHPPRLSGFGFLWPGVRDEDWCGEWKPNDDA